jgi:hypothetical protein
VQKRLGYIAISRGIFDHPLLKSTRPFSRLEAWEWLINAAAWRPRGHVWRFGVLHIERGELAASVRELANRWLWSKSSVHRFLQLLAREAMIALTDSSSGTRSGTRTGTVTQRAPAIITICNYDKFQHLMGGRRSNLGHEAGHEAGHERQQAFPIPGLFASEPTNHLNQSQGDRSSGKKKGRDEKPPHDAKGRGMVWCDYGTEQWQMYADDYREARGVEKLPENRIGGRGNWFRILGEPKPRGRRRA